MNMKEYIRMSSYYRNIINQEKRDNERIISYLDRLIKAQEKPKILAKKWTSVMNKKR